MTDDLFTKRVPVGADTKMLMQLARDTALRQVIKELCDTNCKLPGMVLATAIVEKMHADSTQELSLRIYRAASKAGVALHDISQIGTDADMATGEIELVLTLEGLK